MLWDIIRDWFVQYVFGGLDSQGVPHGGTVGQVFWDDGADQFISNSSNVGLFLPLNGFHGDETGVVKYISMGDWLSTTATIITLIAMCVALFFVVKWLFKMFAGMISGVGR